jgi:hypothetical protein
LGRVVTERLTELRAGSGGSGAVPGSRGVGLNSSAAEVEAGRFRRYGAYSLALYMLATSRWGSYLPLGLPPYFTDIVLFGLITERIVTTAVGRAKPVGVDPALAFATFAMIGWSLILIPVGQFGATAIRDAAPYLYAITVFLVGPPGDSRSARNAAGRALTLALVFHAAWITANTIDKSFWEHMPQIGNNVFLFLPRPDIDGAISGLLCVISLHRALSGRSASFNLGLAAWGAVLVFRTYSRASLLAFFAELLVLVLLSPVRARITAPSRRLVAPFVLAIVLVSLPPAWFAAQGSLPVQRLLDTNAGAQGTTGARAKSWRKVARYLEADPARLVRGVGFGPDFLHNSGGDIALLGGTFEEVRAPHNYIINTWARLGLIGLLPMFGMMLAGWRLAVKLGRAEPDPSDADVLAITSVIALPVAATFGVILESPFGAIPYFWALGHLSVRNIQVGAVAPVGARVREAPRPSSPALASPAKPNARLDINRATLGQLRALNLTRSQCVRLIAWREDCGGFSSLDELDALPGFPQEVLAELKRRLRV